MTMIAQASPEVAKSLIDRLPDILKSVAGNPLGFAALMLLILSVVAVYLFRSSKSKDKIKLIAFGTVAVCCMLLAAMVVHQVNKPPTANPIFVTDCKVAGHVYDGDARPAVGIQNVRLSYIAYATTNVQPLQVATTGPDGAFQFTCSQIKQDAFPIRLRALYRNMAVESEDALFFGENPSVNLYLSPTMISNHYRANKQVLRLSSAQLLQKNFTALTNATKPPQTPVGNVLTVPKGVKLDVQALRSSRFQ